MWEGPLLGVAKAARAPPFTLPILGRRFHFLSALTTFLFTIITAFSIKKIFKETVWR